MATSPAKIPTKDPTFEELDRHTDQPNHLVEVPEPEGTIYKDPQSAGILMGTILTPIYTFTYLRSIQWQTLEPT